MFQPDTIKRLEKEIKHRAFNGKLDVDYFNLVMFLKCAKKIQNNEL